MPDLWEAEMDCPRPSRFSSSEFDPGGVFPAMPAKRNARIECPHIARDDFVTSTWPS
mgnify:CR=1 FL=1